MKDLNPRLALYREAMTLEEKRTTLQAQLDVVLSKLNDINNRLLNTTSSASASPSGESRAPVTRTSAPRTSLSGKRARRGELKSQVLAALSAAGTSGISVKEITATTGAKPTSVHSLLQSARKQYPIKRISQGRYRLEGSVSFDAPATESKASKPGRPSGRSSKKSTRPLSKRGELQSRILSELRSAGSNGVKVSDLADNLGVKRKNLFIWFATTGRRNSGIKKVAESHYRLEE